MNSVTLNDGIVIDFNTRASSGYKQSSFNNKQRQYLAWVKKDDLLDTDPRVNLVQPGSSPTFTLGWFNDSREAAYAAAYFSTNRKTVLDQYFNSVTSAATKIDRQQVFSVIGLGFPSDLYTLPQSAPQTARIKSAKVSFKTTRVSKAKAAINIDNRPAKDFIVAKIGFALVKDLIAKFGREAVQTAHDNLSVNEYELRFGI